MSDLLKAVAAFAVGFLVTLMAGAALAWMTYGD